MNSERLIDMQLIESSGTFCLFYIGVFNLNVLVFDISFEFIIFQKVNRSGHVHLEENVCVLMSWKKT